MRLSSYQIPVSALKWTQTVHLAWVTDLHLGTYQDAEMMIAGLKSAFVQSRNPFSAILLGGDYLDHHTSALPDLAKVMRYLNGLNVPIIGVPGNHDYGAFGVDKQPASLLGELFLGEGATLLINQTYLLKTSAGDLLLVGMDDLQHNKAYYTQGKQPKLAVYKKRAQQLDWYEAFDQDHPGMPRLLLNHNPDAVWLPGKPRPLAVLAGHTHGGQIKPLHLLQPLLPNSFPPNSFGTWAGQRLVSGTSLIVSNGVGATGLPFRVGAPAEVIDLQLLPQTIPENLVIGISGKPRTGKDTLAQMIQALLPGIQRTGFSYVVKEEFDKVHGTNIRHNEEEKHRYREALDDFSDPFLAKDPEIWIRQTMEKTKPPMLISDVRLLPEAEAVRKARGVLIRVTCSPANQAKRIGRAGRVKEPNRRQEIELDNYAYWDYVIENNSTLLVLEKRVRQIIREILARPVV